METVGIAIDDYKLTVFTKHLNAAGYAFTTNPGLTPGTLLLQVQAESIAAVGEICRAAQRECSRNVH